MKKKFVLKGEYSEGKKLLVRYVLRKFWKNFSYSHYRPPRFYYRLALLRMKGISQAKIGRLFKMSPTAVSLYEKKLERKINRYCEITERTPIS